MANTNDGLSWGESTPQASDARKDGADEIRGLRKGVRLRMEKEHEDMAVMSGSSDSAGGGEHLKGSAKAFYEDNSPGPATRPDGNAFTSDDAGRLWIDITAGNVLKVRTASSFELVGGVQIASSSFTGAQLAAGQRTASAGFVVDMFFLIVPVNTDTFQFAIPLINDATQPNVSQWTTVNRLSIDFERSSNDVLVELNAANTLTPTGTCQWVAYKF